MLPVRIAYASIVLRRFRAGDAERVATLCSDRAVATTTAAIPHPYTREMAQEWIAGQEIDDAPEHTYAVLRRDDDVLVGAVGVRPLETAPDMLGYWIGKEYWRRGYATDAAAAIVALAFTLLDVEVLRASHLDRNPASGRVLAKCGFRETGTQMRMHRDAQVELCRLWEIDRARWVAWVERRM